MFVVDQSQTVMHTCFSDKKQPQGIPRGQDGHGINEEGLDAPETCVPSETLKDDTVYIDAYTCSSIRMFCTLILGLTSK